MSFPIVSLALSCLLLIVPTALSAPTAPLVNQELLQQQHEESANNKVVEYSGLVNQLEEFDDAVLTPTVSLCKELAKSLRDPKKYVDPRLKELCQMVVEFVKNAKDIMKAHEKHAQHQLSAEEMQLEMDKSSLNIFVEVLQKLNEIWTPLENHFAHTGEKVHIFAGLRTVKLLGFRALISYMQDKKSAIKQLVNHEVANPRPHPLSAPASNIYMCLSALQLATTFYLSQAPAGDAMTYLPMAMANLSVGLWVYANILADQQFHTNITGEMELAQIAEKADKWTDLFFGPQTSSVRGEEQKED